MDAPSIESSSPVEQSEAYRAGFAAGWTQGWKKGLDDGINHKRSIITLENEEHLPLEFADFIDENEREIVASIVRMPQYKEFFRQSLLRQSILKHRQARMYLRQPQVMNLLHNFGNWISDLVVFFDNADTMDGTRIEPYHSHGYDEVPLDD